MPRFVAPVLASLAFSLGGCVTSHQSPPAAAARPPTASLGCADCAACAFPPPAPPVGVDALARWREHLPAFSTAFAAAGDHLVELAAADSPAPPDAPEWMIVAEHLADFDLGPGECLVFQPCHGPETPFPDHTPLRSLALARAIETRRLIARDELAGALMQARQNLALARATLRGQTGLIALIHAMSVWQSALDGAHALARCPKLPTAEADALRRELEDDSGLLAEAVSRAFRGEYTYVLAVIVARLPETDNVDLLLSAISTLGMAPPEPLGPGEPGVGRSPRPPLDRAATLAAFRADLIPYLQALETEARLPRGLQERVTGAAISRIRAEIPNLLDYAEDTVAWSPLVGVKIHAELARVENPVGKLLFTYLTSSSEDLIKSALRREAQRAAVCGLLAWRAHGAPAPWAELIEAGRLKTPPADPFSDGELRWNASPGQARIWSVYADGNDQGGKAEPGNSGQPTDLVWPW